MVRKINLSQCLDENKLYLNDIRDDLKKSDRWKIQLAIAISFVSSKETDEECVMHSNNDNIKIMVYDKVDMTLLRIVLNHFLIGIKLGSEH